MTHECGANIAVQNCFRGIGVRTGFPAQLQDVRGRNSAAPAQSGEAAGGPLPPRKQLPHRARRRPTHRHDGRAGQTALLARRKTRQHRPLSSTGPKDLRNPLAVRPAEPPQRDGVSGIAEIAARVRPKPALQPGGHLRHRPPAKTLQAPRLCAVRTDRRVQGCAVPADVSDARGVRGGRHAVAQCSLRLRPEIRAALDKLPLSHRCDKFKEEVALTKTLLCQLVRAQRVEILLGSGTLANDAIAAQLALMGAPGIILNNGEFGSRLVDHARRFGLSFHAHEIEWGAGFGREHVRQTLDRHRDARWLWAVACETSTGILNEVDWLKELCAGRGIKLCLDCISVIGTAPVDLHGVSLASCVSGKGLGAFPGLSMVFYHEALAPRPDKLPRYLDLGYYAAQSGVPFTHSSNLLSALQAALKR